MRQNLESSYISRLDNAKTPRPEIGDQGSNAEQAVVNFLNAQAGIETRLSSSEEDSGKSDIGPRQILDAISYIDGKPVLGLQITTATDSVARAKKLKEISDRPYLRLPEMGNNELAIPRVLVYVDANKVKSLQEDKDILKHPDLALQIIDSIVKSLQFDLNQTKNMQEASATKKLIEMMTAERKKYLH